MLAELKRKENLRYFLFCFVIAFVTYYVKLTNQIISLDTERVINDMRIYDGGWISSGRWALVLLQRLVNSKDMFNPFFSDLVMAVFFSMSILVMMRTIAFLWQREETDSRQQWEILLILSCIIITSPVLAEQYWFTIQCAGVAIAMFFLCMSIGCSCLVIYHKKYWLMPMSILLLVVAFGTYQAFYPLYICLAAFIFSLELLSEGQERSTIRCLKDGVKFVLFFAAGALLNRLVCYLAYQHFGITESAYLPSLIQWGKGPFREVVSRVIKYILATVFPKNNSYFNWSLLISYLAILCALILLTVQRKKHRGLLWLSLLICAFSPFLLCVVEGSEVLYRSQFAVSYTTAALLVLSYIVSRRKLWKTVILVFCIVTAFVQMRATSNLFYSDLNRYQEDVRQTQDIMAKIDLLSPEGASHENETIAFIGSRGTVSSAVRFEGETSSDSFYQWDSQTLMGGNNRINGFCRIIGYSYQMPTNEQMKEALAMSSDMPDYPANGSIRILNDQLVVVKLSEGK